MIDQIGKVTLYVNNVEEAKKFWTEKLKFIVKFEKEMSPEMKWLEVAPNDESFTTFVLYDKNLMEKQNISNPSIILSTKNIEDTYKELELNNVKIDLLQVMPYGKMFSFYDMDDNMFLIRED